MNFNLTPTIDIFEVLWSVASLIGFIVAAYFAFDSWRDWWVQRVLGGDDGSVALAIANLVNALSKSVAFSLFGGLGIRTMQYPGPVDGHIDRAGLFIRLALIIGQSLLVFGMSFAQFIRKQVLIKETKLAQDRLQRTADEARIRLEENTHALNRSTEAMEHVAEAIKENTNTDRRNASKDIELNETNGESDGHV